MRPAFEAAAVLRYFNADSLAAVLDGADTASLYEELRRWPFTRPRDTGLAVHDTMREVMTDTLRARSPEQFRQLNERAAAHYARLLATAGSEDRERLQLEWLYHSVRADEAAGIKQFQEMAEKLVRYQWVSQLRALMNDVNTYPLGIEDSRLWRRYYAARLEHIEGRTAAAEGEYLAIGHHDEAESRLRAYALCDLGAIYVTFDRLSEPDGERRARDAIEQSQAAHPALDLKLVANQVSLMNLSNTRAAWAESLEHLRPMRAFVESTGDTYGIVTVNLLESTIHGLLGNWLGYLEARRRCEETLQPLGDVPALQMQVAYFTWPLLYMGRYREAQESSERALKLAIRLEEKELMITILESVALALGMQDAYTESAQRFDEAWNFYENFHLAGSEHGTRGAERYIRALLSFRGLVALREGRLDAAETDLLDALRIKQQIRDRIGMPELHVWRGLLAELRGGWDEAEAAYQDALELRSVNRRYFAAAAQLGLVRLNYGRGRFGDSADAVGAAEEIAQRYEYNDLLASLRLFQGHLAWERHGHPEGADATVAHYQEALVYALRYNRYLLDEVVEGRSEGTALVPIIPACMERGSAGREILQRLQEWWRSGTNDLQPQRAASVSPLKGGVPLIDAERDARNRERDAGVPQRTVLERIGKALGNEQSGV
jgi:tetratricopeptide (TPR) repeat protein